MTTYKQVKCLKCGNIYISKRKIHRCIKGTGAGCGSTLGVIQDKYKIEEQTPDTPASLEIHTEQQEEDLF